MDQIEIKNEVNPLTRALEKLTTSLRLFTSEDEIEILESNIRNFYEKCKLQDPNSGPILKHFQLDIEELSEKLKTKETKVVVYWENIAINARLWTCVLSFIVLLFAWPILYDSNKFDQATSLTAFFLRDGLINFSISFTGILLIVFSIDSVLGFFISKLVRKALTSSELFDEKTVTSETLRITPYKFGRLKYSLLSISIIWAATCELLAHIGILGIYGAILGTAIIIIFITVLYLYFSERIFYKGDKL